MKWLLLVCWLNGAEFRCDEPILKNDYAACIRASNEIIKQHYNVVTWCKPNPKKDITYEIN